MKKFNQNIWKTGTWFIDSVEPTKSNRIQLRILKELKTESIIMRYVQINNESDSKVQKLEGRYINIKPEDLKGNFLSNFTLNIREEKKREVELGQAYQATQANFDEKIAILPQINRALTNSRNILIHILNVGHGDTIIFELVMDNKDENKFIIMDCKIGHNNNVSAKIHNIIKGRTILTWIVSHPHEDHIKGLNTFLSNYAPNVNLVLIKPTRFTSPLHIELIRNNPSRIYTINNHINLFNCGNYFFDLIPTLPPDNDINNNGLTLIISHLQHGQFIFGGDASGVTILSSMFCKFDTLNFYKVSHHCSQTSQPQTLANRFNNAATSGPDNARLPHRNTLRIIDGMTIFSHEKTYRHGDLLFDVNQNRFI